MIATWMLYALALAAAASGVALAAEYALRLYGRSTRWLWATSLGAALALPLAAWVLTAPPAPAALGAIGEPVAVAAPAVDPTMMRPSRISRSARLLDSARIAMISLAGMITHRSSRGTPSPTPPRPITA